MDVCLPFIWATLTISTGVTLSVFCTRLSTIARAYYTHEGQWSNEGGTSSIVLICTRGVESINWLNRFGRGGTGKLPRVGAMCWEWSVAFSLRPLPSTCPQSWDPGEPGRGKVAHNRQTFLQQMNIVQHSNCKLIITIQWYIYTPSERAPPNKSPYFARERFSAQLLRRKGRWL